MNPNPKAVCQDTVVLEAQCSLVDPPDCITFCNLPVSFHPLFLFQVKGDIILLLVLLCVTTSQKFNLCHFVVPKEKLSN